MEKPSEDLLRYKWINLKDFEFICFSLAKKHLQFNEPFPDYKTTDIQLLESSLAAPRQRFDFLNASLEDQASVLFYSLIKNHPFQNGNKRIAVMTLLVFLYLNQRWLDILPLELYKIAIDVANSKSVERENIIKENKKMIEEYIVSLND